MEHHHAVRGDSGVREHNEQPSHRPLGGTVGNASPLSLTSLTFNTNGTTTPATDITNAKVWYTGTSSTFATTTQFGSTVATPSGSHIVAGSQVLAEGTNYFWLTYDVPNSAKVNNLVDAECTSVNVGGAQAPSVTAPAGTRIIKAQLNGVYTIGASQVAPNYTLLSSALSDLNTYGANGPVTFQLATDYASGGETFPLVVSAYPGNSVTNTLLIKPAATVTAAITGSNSSSIIRLNGADYVTIDGSNAGTSSRNLTITNTNGGTSSAIVWLQSNGADGATNNTFKNLNLVGTTVTATAGTLIAVGSGSSTISATSFGTGNNNNTYQNNNITKTSYGVYSGGASAGNKNTGTVITQNVMNAASPNNITIGGILVNFDNGVQVTQNDISVLRHDGTTGTTGTTFGIAIGVVPNNSVTTFTGNDVTGSTVTRNKINGVTQLNATGYSAFGIVINGVTSGTSLVANNMVSGVRSAATSSDFSAGIVAGGGVGSTTQVYYNSVSMTGSRGAATFPSYALAIGGSNPTVDVRNNILYNTQTSSSTAKSYAIGLAYPSPYTNLTSDQNDLFTSGAQAAFGQTGGLGTTGTDRTTIALWRTETGKDAASISNDPLFVSTTDLHITSTSPCYNTGTAVGGTTVDFDGDTRPQGPAYDIGADEDLVLCSAPVATAGGPQTICALGTTTGLGGNAAGSGTGTWSVFSGGTGTFSGLNDPNASFSPSSGTSLVLRWTITETGCPTTFASVTITVVPAATANANGPYNVCGATAVAISATAGGAGTWSGGAGSFASATSASTTYTPTNGEVGSAVTITWTTTGTSPCPDVPSNASVNVNTPATANANGPYSVCGATAVAISATASGAGTWSGGAGSFASATSASTTYTPTNGEVGSALTITWTTTGTSPCPDVPSNASVIVNTPATANANGPYAACGSTAVAISATASGAGTWSGGAGSFASATSASTMYTPTIGEVGSAVTLTWTTTGTSPCPDVPSNASVNVIAPPNAGTDGSIIVCNGAAPFSLFALLGGNPQTGGAWSGPSPVSGDTYAASTMDPGTYTYTVNAIAPCTGNATATVSVSESGNAVVLRINTDANASQISWEIKDAADATVASGSPVGNNTQVDQTLCLSNANGSCYTLKLTDSFGDGIIGGGWELRTADGKTILKDSFSGGAVSGLGTVPVATCRRPSSI
ncbi:MAG: BNR-repeat neuraminidase N-terminal domain-containing protein [Flavobacteriales bacterium]